ncbi:MAG: enoyl-CoA hydratase-related protein [Solirubrobacteraceae bacterium]
MTDLVLTEDHGRVRHIVLNRPEKRNAFNAALITALDQAVRATAAAGDVHVVVLRGAGPMFSSGVDLKELAGPEAPAKPAAGGEAAGRDRGEGGMEQLRPFRKAWLDVANALEELTKPVVCAIQGGCIGGALETALACDLRVMAADAITGLPETRIGLIPDVGGSSRLPQVVGLGRAKELIMTGKLIDGTEAERIGLVNRVAPADELDAAVDQLVEELLACAPVAVGLSKRVIDASARPALSTTLELEVALQTVCAATEDFAEGARAFAEKRQPEFSGR